METLQYKLQKFDPGVVVLDSGHRVMSMNFLAQKILGNILGNPIGRDVLQLHPEKSRAKIELLLRDGDGQCPAESPPPMTMIINIPDRVLLIKVTKLGDGSGAFSTCMMFYDLTDITTREHDDTGDDGKHKQLVKIPVVVRNRVILISLSDVAHMQAVGHYTNIFTSDQKHFCNLSLSDLELRLNPEQFMRVHRSHIISLHHVHSVERENEQYHVVLDTGDRAVVPRQQGAARSGEGIFRADLSINRPGAPAAA
ncbi:LytR/AlgR family response regulator transcription factor [Sinimarinibacterium flocculans]|uniref:LytTR family transcriptional regulator n=1 Tax=Sinimarinibacterium flocculans TaxID=985250 RepID=A0A318E3K1_9GAMM|nr:LytTR family DNA-binding domain-containing protein [Sinimarinibacterium flocculans]PXV65702.1 LytTR family transcriptional regulator [Sinimarinibacterium flocculans]